jgi:hypothetical protein
MHYNARTFSDPSNLSEGVHPAFLIEVVEEPVPEGWAMREKDLLMWRWNFAVWATPADIQTTKPELQSTVSSRTFSSGGKYQPSKAFVWMKALLNRDIAKGEGVDPNDLVPLPCQLYITKRNKQGEVIDFANIKDLTPWPDGAALLPAVREYLKAWWEERQHGLAAEKAKETPPPAAPPQWAQPAQTTQPQASPAPQQPELPATAKKGW